MDKVSAKAEAPRLFINRELSNIAFQYRVLEEAQDETNPLIERVRFLAMVGDTLDEFFMVRVGGLKMQVASGIINLSSDGLTPAEQLAAIRKATAKLMARANDYWNQTLIPELDQAGVHILNYPDLTEKQKANADDYFDRVIFPVLTPLAFDPGHPFPHISNLSLNLGIVIKDEQGESHFARVKVPATLPRLVPIKRSSGGVRKDGTVPHHHFFVWIEQVIAANLDKLFPEMEVIESHAFRVTRNADIEIQELEADDLIETMAENVRDRRFGSVVRLTITESMPEMIRNILTHNLDVDPNDVFIFDNPLGLTSSINLYTVDRYDLKYPSFIPTIPDQLKGESEDRNLIAELCKEQIFLHHPYDSFAPVVEFLRTAARDPNVLAIKQTLYRVGRNSPVVNALLEARREYGKQVAVLVELKARFDEESNIEWARLLEREGVHVTYGLVGLKTHAKIAMVIRKEGEAIQRYVHMGTGNYNQVTAQTYEDIGMFTCDDEIGADITDLFNFLTGYSAKKDYRKLLVAPINMRKKLESFIGREIKHQKSGKGGHIIFKTNALVDENIIKLLYKASQTGVKVDLIVRGICCLRPGVKGLSENIQVRSIVGRFLEHSRIYYFKNGGKEQIFLGSADLMPRNLDRRVEILFPIEDPQTIAFFRSEILAIYLADSVKARHMLPNGEYQKVPPADSKPPLNSQLHFLGIEVMNISPAKTGRRSRQLSS